MHQTVTFSEYLLDLSSRLSFSCFVIVLLLWMWTLFFVAVTSDGSLEKAKEIIAEWTIARLCIKVALVAWILLIFLP